MNAEIEIKGDKIVCVTKIKGKTELIICLFAHSRYYSSCFNLRPAITSVGPVVGMIKEDIGLSYWSVSLLTSLPLIAFAVMSPITPKIANKLSNEKALLWGLVCILAGIIIRSFSMGILLFAGTFLIGAGIAICNVLLPVIIKDKYP